MDDPVALVDAAMARIRRSMSQRRLGREILRELPQADLVYIGVLDAVELRDEPTVGDVATHLGLDPSRASRLVAGAVKAGLVERVALAGDARRVGLRTTAGGHAIQRRFTELRRGRFAQAMAEMAPEDQADFARLLTQFVDGIDAHLADPR